MLGVAVTLLAGPAHARTSLLDVDERLSVLERQDQGDGTQLIIDSVVVSEAPGPVTLFDIVGVNFSCGQSISILDLPVP